MKSPSVKSLIALPAIGLALTATPAYAVLSEIVLLGSGTVETNCHLALNQGCTLSSQGPVSGTGIADGVFELRIDTGSPTSLNGHPVATPQGICVPASFKGRVTSSAGDTMEFNHSGIVCEEAGPGSPMHYNAAFRITQGTGIFAAAAGNGTLTATLVRWSQEQPSKVFFHLRGVIDQ